MNNLSADIPLMPSLKTQQVLREAKQLLLWICNVKGHVYAPVKQTVGRMTVNTLQFPLLWYADENGHFPSSNYFYL